LKKKRGGGYKATDASFFFSNFSFLKKEQKQNKKGKKGKERTSGNLLK
jgi:hypothetical protein